MARIYYKNDDGEYIRDDDGAYMTGEPDDCCCESCDCETQGPTALFSYEQISDDPCTVNLYDESTPGECGEIVAWRWLLNGVEFSTSQNPGGIVIENGDEVMLEVTDSEGCTDVAAGLLGCGVMVDCGCCSDEIPDVLTVVASGFSNKAACLEDCTTLNGTFDVPYILTSSGVCIFNLELTGDQCDGTTNKMNINIRVCQSGFIQVSMNPHSFTSYIYRLSPPGGICRGTHVLTFDSFTGTDYCNRPATISITI